MGLTLVLTNDFEECLARREGREILALFLERLVTRESTGASRGLEMRGEL
jgi:hypothetical protein